MGINYYAKAKFSLHKANARSCCGGKQGVGWKQGCSHGGTLAQKHHTWVWMELITKNGVKSPRKRDLEGKLYLRLPTKGKRNWCRTAKATVPSAAYSPLKAKWFQPPPALLQRWQQIWEPPCSTELRRARWNPAFPVAQPVYLIVSTGLLKDISVLLLLETFPVKK